MTIGPDESDMTALLARHKSRKAPGGDVASRKAAERKAVGRNANRFAGTGRVHQINFQATDEVKQIVASAQVVYGMSMAEFIEAAILAYAQSNGGFKP